MLIFNLFLFVFLFFNVIPFYVAWQDVSPEDIPIMLVGNKCDLRKDGVNCVPTSYGEKLAMVIRTKSTPLIILVKAF